MITTIVDLLLLTPQQGEGEVAPSSIRRTGEGEERHFATLSSSLPFVH